MAARQDAMERERGAGSRGVPRLWAKREERAGEKSDQPHAVAAVGAGLVGLDGDWFVGFAAVDCDHRWVGCGCCEQLTAEGEFGAAVAIGEMAVMSPVPPGPAFGRTEDRFRQWPGRPCCATR